MSEMNGSHKSFSDSRDRDHGQWEFPSTARTLVTEEMVRIAVSYDHEKQKYTYEPRLRISAASVLLAMHKQNRADQQMTGQHELSTLEERRTRLLAIAEQFKNPGIDQHTRPKFKNRLNGKAH